MTDHSGAPRILVTGASIAGPALAYWLWRRGAEVTVLEQAPALRPGGQAVDARGVAKEAIRRMGLEDAVLEARTRTAGAHTVDADGRILESTSAQDAAGDGYIAEIEILRGDLARLLVDATRDTVEYRFGDRIDAVRQDADGVDVALASGRRERYDLVIGAEGLHSRLRRQVFGPDEEFVRHLGLALAFYTVPDETGLDGWATDYHDGSRFAGLRPLPDGQRAIAMLAFPVTDAEFDGAHRDPARQRALLRAGMAGAGWRIPRLLEHLDGADDLYLDQVAQVVMRRWHDGRIGLFGDAAFCASPMSGAGTGLALVGALLLASELAAADWDPTAGYAAFDARMRDCVEANQQLGRMHVEQVTGTGPGDEPDLEELTALIARAIDSPALPAYDGLPDRRGGAAAG